MIFKILLVPPPGGEPIYIALLFVKFLIVNDPLPVDSIDSDPLNWISSASNNMFPPTTAPIVNTIWPAPRIVKLPVTFKALVKVTVPEAVIVKSPSIVTSWSNVTLIAPAEVPFPSTIVNASSASVPPTIPLKEIFPLLASKISLSSPASPSPSKLWIDEVPILILVPAVRVIVLSAGIEPSIFTESPIIWPPPSVISAPIVVVCPEPSMINEESPVPISSS